MVCGGIAGIFVAGENCVIMYTKCLQMMGVKKSVGKICLLLIYQFIWCIVKIVVVLNVYLQVIIFLFLYKAQCIAENPTQLLYPAELS